MKQGQASAHLTDLIKVRATANDVPLLFYNPRVSVRHRRYFKHEVDIVRPRVMVALGQQVVDVLRGWGFVVPDGTGWKFKVSGKHKAAVIATVHPAATRWPQKTLERRRRFRRDMRRARRLLRANS